MHSRFLHENVKLYQCYKHCFYVQYAFTFFFNKRHKELSIGQFVAKYFQLKIHPKAQYFNGNKTYVTYVLLITIYSLFCYSGEKYQNER